MWQFKRDGDLEHFMEEVVKIAQSSLYTHHQTENCQKIGMPSNYVCMCFRYMCSYTVLVVTFITLTTELKFFKSYSMLLLMILLIYLTKCNLCSDGQFLQTCSQIRQLGGNIMILLGLLAVYRVAVHMQNHSHRL